MPWMVLGLSLTIPLLALDTKVLKQTNTGHFYTTQVASLGATRRHVQRHDARRGRQGAMEGPSNFQPNNTIFLFQKKTGCIQGYLHGGCFFMFFPFSSGCYFSQHPDSCGAGFVVWCLVVHFSAWKLRLHFCFLVASSVLDSCYTFLFEDRKNTIFTNLSTFSNKTNPGVSVFPFQKKRVVFLSFPSLHFTKSWCSEWHPGKSSGKGDGSMGYPGCPAGRQ